MKLVLDTNVLIAALVTHGACAEVVERCFLYHEVVLSGYILEELAKNLRKKLGYTVEEIKSAQKVFKERAILVQPTEVSVTACADSSDLPILGTALAGSCVCLITGDGDLLKLRKFQGIDIITPALFWKYQVNK